MWHAIITGEGQDWNSVIVGSGLADDTISAVVPFPLLQEWKVKRHGPMCAQEFRPWINEAAALRQGPEKEQRAAIHRYRTGSSADAAVRYFYQRFADLLEELLGLPKMT